ncbi:uncharacterized protein BDW70DRAFT_145957 [Aspergillus foveolatus]|uniref:uncharacterized protein n=1 Tax=Aspergillus foveolatus TaxID=210207 RepID=UPI003CCDC28F
MKGQYKDKVMKICLINSSYEGVNSPFEEFDEFPDPGRYISKDRHEFVTRFVSKANAKAEIDEICKEGFDMFMNYMWGIETDEVAGIEATQYLESKGVPILTNPSSFLAKTKLDLQSAATAAHRNGNRTFRVPGNTPGRYPKIVKYSDGCGSLKLDEASICYTEQEVASRIALLKGDKSLGSKFGVMVQDYIVGRECSAIVVEMGRELVALTPLRYVFPEDTPPNKEFLTWFNKFTAVDKGIIRYAFVEEQPAMADLQNAAVDAFKALGVAGGGGWARVDMRLEDTTGDVYVLEVNSIPVVFYPKGNTLGDDLVVAEKFPGGQAALFDMLLATKQMQLGWHREQAAAVAVFYNGLAQGYDRIWEGSGMCTMQKFLLERYDFSGSVLDLACGTGAFARGLHDNGVQADVIGIDLSPSMTENPDVKKVYKEVRIGPMQELIMGAGEHDHIVCFGAFNFLPTESLVAVLARSFMLARKSFTFDVENATAEFCQKTKERLGASSFNHVVAVEDFGIPKGWKRVLRERRHAYQSPSTGDYVDSYFMRFERV